MPGLKGRLKLIFLSPILGVALAILVCLLIAGYSLWYTSGGNFPAFPKLGKDNYYIDLAEAFLHGQLSMLKEPQPELMALENPYNPKERRGIPYQFDYSYYRGKYYLYWGPVPGLVLAGIEGVTQTRPPNILMTVISYIGLTFLFLVTLIQIRNQFFPAAPELSLGILVLGGLVNIPFLFLLGRPEVYETSIMAGQLFLFLGLASWTIYMATASPAWLAITGLGWGLAVGSRYDLAISALLFVGQIIIWIGTEAKWKNFWSKLCLLLIPFAGCVLGLGIYNFARFGNPLETGLTYQLTVPIQHYFLISYLPANFYAYFFYPLTVANKFPFIGISLFGNAMLPAWFEASSATPGKLFDPVMAGLFPSSPTLWLLALSVPLTAILWRSYFRYRPALTKRFVFFMLILVGGAAQLLVVLVYYYGAMRYAADFYLLLTVTVAMLAWRIDEMLQPTPRLRICFWIVVAGLALSTAGIGFFGGFDVPPRIFHSYSPALYSRLSSYWDHRFQNLKAIVDALWIPRILHFILHAVS
ncbi:MAG TPA: hypothetical protein VLX61_11960 [Anaerolineales bacterium]|nr:hypothetical protein [Anaerolineales bacterium]